MARLSRTTRTRGRTAFAARTAPFVLFAQASQVLRDGRHALSQDDRARLSLLLSASKGRPMHLTPGQRAELAELVSQARVESSGTAGRPVASRRGTHRRGSLRRR